MAKSKDPILKRCRSLGIEPAYLGYDKKSNKNPKVSRRKVSEYGLQLKEKQKTKFIYGVLEKQFRNYFEMASNKKGIVGENLLQILESRLDNVVFRLGLGTTRPQARQLVNHGVSIREIRRDNPVIKANVETDATHLIPEWLELSSDKLSGKVLRLPNRDEIDLPVEEHLIVELYSK